MQKPAQIIILNGAPRAGKSSIAGAIQDTFEGPWMNLGADAYIRRITPSRYRPSIGLRPGGERPDLEPLVAVMFAALYESIAAHSRLGLNVVADLGHHESYANPWNNLAACAQLVRGLPVLFVGVRCPVETIMERRNASPEDHYAKGTEEIPIPEPVQRWQDEVHAGVFYDLEVDTSLLTPSQCADRIRVRLQKGPPGSAFENLASLP
jgi:chloramphenicol 3-O phosphotransferase